MLTCACTQVVNESSAMLRLDQHFSTKTTGFMRFNYDRSVDTQPLSASATDLQQKVSTPVNGVLELLHVFNPHLVNEVSAGFNRSTDNQYNYSDSGIIYQIAVSGWARAGIRHRELRLHQHLRGQLVFGDRQPDLGSWPAYLQNRRGVPPHSNEPGIRGTRKAYVFLGGESGSNAVKKATLTGALPVNDLRKNDYFVYAQDEYKWRPNLVLNLGLRYTIFDLFTEKNGLADPFDFATCGPQGFCGVGASFGQSELRRRRSPRGLCLDARKERQDGDSRWIRHYHEDGQLDDQNLPAKNEVPSYSAVERRSRLSRRIQLPRPSDHRITHSAPEPSHRMPNNGIAKTRMLSSGASRCSRSCRRTSSARSPIWEATACIC